MKMYPFPKLLILLTLNLSNLGLTQTLRTLGVLGTPVATLRERQGRTSRQSRRQLLQAGKPVQRTASPTHWLVLVNQRCRRVSRRRRLVNPEGGSLRQAAKRLR
nr:hypothetical protein [Nostoc sp. CreGUA01]